jgi:hypothetical protein
MTGAVDLAKMVPGFDFLQGLMKNVGGAIPGLPAMSQWVAPTLDPEELDKRIQELKTVQFWLEQNAKLMATTIQALEVQRMTLSTFKSMNMPLTDLRDALKIKLPASMSNPGASAPPSAATVVTSTAAASAPSKKRRIAAKSVGKTVGKTSGASAATAAPAVDPLQWWGALTQQFSELAARAVKDTAKDAALNLAGAAVKQSISSAGKVLKKAVSAPGPSARTGRSR